MRGGEKNITSANYDNYALCFIVFTMITMMMHVQRVYQYVWNSMYYKVLLPNDCSARVHAQLS